MDNWDTEESLSLMQAVGFTLGAVERTLILDTLGHCAGNRTRAANMLGISIRTLRNKLVLYAGGGAIIPPPPTGADPERRVNPPALARAGASSYPGGRSG